MKKNPIRPYTATNKVKESWNNRYFQNIPKSNYQTNKYNQSHSFNNNLDLNDSNLNEEFSSLIGLWIDLGVTNEYQKIFRNTILNLSNEEKEIVIENEKNNLNKFRKVIIKFTKHASQRDKNIQLLKKFDEIVETTFPDGNKKLNESILNDISNVIEALRYDSVNCVSSIIKLREISFFKSLNGKFNYKRMNKSYIYNNDYLLKMKKDMNFLQNSSLGKYIDFTNGEIDPFLICCTPKKNNRSKRQDKITFPINEDLMKSIKQAKYYLIQDLMYSNIEEETKNNNKSFYISNFINSNNNNNYSTFSSLYKNYGENNNYNRIDFNGSRFKSQTRTSVNQPSRVGSAKTKINQSDYFKNNNFNDLNINRTLYKIKVNNGEPRYNYMFLNSDGDNKIKKQGNYSGNRSNFYINQKNSNKINQNNYQSNKEIIFEESYHSNFNKNKKVKYRIKIEREPIPMISRDEFLKRIDMIGKEKEENYNEDHSMSEFIEENKKIDEEERQKKIKELEEKNRIEEEKKKELNKNRIINLNKEDLDKKKNNESEEKYDDFYIDDSKELDNNVRKKEQEKNAKKEEEEESDDYGGFEIENSKEKKLETNPNDYLIEYYSKDINNLIRNLTEKNYIDKIPENEKKVLNLSEESFYPNNLIKGVYPKILICYPKNENNENITALCNFSYSSFGKPIKILINHLSAINYNNKENSWASQIESSINFIKNNHEYDIIEINFNDNLDEDMKNLFTQNLSFKIDEDNKKIYYNNPNSKNDNIDKFDKFLSIKTASLIGYSIMATSTYFSNDKYINLFNIYCILSEKKNKGEFFLKDIGDKALLIDSMDVNNSLEDNILFSLGNNNFNSLKKFIKEKISNETTFDYLEYNGKNNNDLLCYNYIPPLRSGISFIYQNYYYNRIEDNLEVFNDSSTNSKVYLIPTYDKKNKIIIAELNKNLKRKLIDKNGNLYINFYKFYDSLTVDKESQKNKIILIPSFFLESRLSSPHISNIDKNLKIINNNNDNTMYISSVDEFFKVEWNVENNFKNNISVKINKDDIIIKDTFLFGVFNEKLFDLNSISAIQLFIITKDYWKKFN